MWAARGSAVTIQEMVSGPVSENVHGKSVHKQNRIRNSVRFPVVDLSSRMVYKACWVMFGVAKLS